MQEPVKQYRQIRYGKTGQRGKLFQRSLLLAVLAASLSAIFLLVSACGPRPTIGDINDQAPIVLIRYESIDKDLSGIVYREILDLERFIAESKKPLLFAFYTQRDPVNTELIPLLEQLADDYQDRVGIVFIDAEANPSLSALFSLQKTPQFTVVTAGAIRRSIIGFDESTRGMLEQLVQPWLS